MAIKRPTERNTKPEILAAFDELLNEKKALETKLTQRPASPSVETPNGKSIAPPSPPPPPVNLPKMESVIDGLNNLQLNFGGAVSDLSEKLVLKAVKLQEIRQTVNEEVEQLEALHELEATEGGLDTLIEQYETSAKAFHEELKLRQEAIAQFSTQARKTWTKEQEDHRRLTKEGNEIAAKNRQRDTKEYTYNLTLERKLSTTEYEQEQKRLYSELEALQQAQEKQWAEREQAIAQRETEFSDLKIKAEAMPQQLESAIKRAKEEGKGIGNQQAKIKADLRTKEIEGNRRTYELRLDFLRETIEDQQARITRLSQQLEAALKQVQDLAVKAIEGASDLNSFEAVREIAIEQAKSQNKAK